ncbi:unnamed protein product [Prorocentrum cordatum]|uniref:BCD1 alpha/beta domain-containing protein n=1 Tax=Prorocentrum cordatum TaxID=2364126 RepID=A0ABN9UI21_9DINO|nr:unnamed protein product [Polarella glacialis]
MGAKPEYIAWKVDWHFRASGQLLTDRGLPEHEVIGPALDRFLQNTCPWGATRHLVLPYADAGLEALEVFLHQPRRTVAPVESFSRDTRWNEVDDRESDSDDEDEAQRASRRAAMAATLAALPEFLRLDKGRSLRENLIGRAIVEFPVLHVALPSEVAQYEGTPMG